MNHLFCPETGCKGEATKEQHHEVKSSQQLQEEAVREKEKKALICLYPKENDIAFFDQRENRGNMEVGEPGERERKTEKQRLSGKETCQWKKS